MISAILMLRGLAGALRVALREEDFARILAAGLALIIIGTIAYSVGGGWSLVDGLYVAVATLTTSSVLDPKLTVTDPWLKVFTAGGDPLAMSDAYRSDRGVSGPPRSSRSTPPAPCRPASTVRRPSSSRP